MDGNSGENLYLPLAGARGHCFALWGPLSMQPLWKEALLNPLEGGPGAAVKGAEVRSLSRRTASVGGQQPGPSGAWLGESHANTGCQWGREPEEGGNSSPASRRPGPGTRDWGPDGVFHRVFQLAAEGLGGEGAHGNQVLAQQMPWRNPASAAWTEAPVGSGLGPDVNRLDVVRSSRT